MSLGLSLAMALAVAAPTPLRLPPSPPFTDLTTAFKALCVSPAARLDDVAVRARLMHWREASPPDTSKAGIVITRRLGFKSPDGAFSLVADEANMQAPSLNRGQFRSCLVMGEHSAPQPVKAAMTEWAGHPPDASFGAVIAWNVPPTRLDTGVPHVARVLLMTNAASSSTALTLQVPN